MKEILKCHWCGWIGEEADLLSMTIHHKDGTDEKREHLCPGCQHLSKLDEYDRINVSDEPDRRPT